MKVYRIDAPSGEVDFLYAGTLARAKEIVNGYDPVFRADIKVWEEYLRTHKDSILDILNGGDGSWDGVRNARSWRGSARGGLKKILP